MSTKMAKKPNPMYIEGIKILGNWAGGMAQVVRCLPSKCKALSCSNPSTNHPPNKKVTRHYENKDERN
jgi:hypothetical protein